MSSPRCRAAEAREGVIGHHRRLAGQPESIDDVKLFVWVVMGFAVVFGALQAVTSAVAYHDLRVAKEGVATEELARVFD